MLADRIGLLELNILLADGIVDFPNVSLISKSNWIGLSVFLRIAGICNPCNAEKRIVQHIDGRHYQSITYHQDRHPTLSTLVSEELGKTLIFL